MKLLRRLVLCGLLLIGLNTASAASGSIALENKIDKSTVRIGDVVTYTLQVSHDDSVEVQLPGRAFVMVDSAMHILPDEALNIRDYRQLPPEKIDGRIVEGVEYEFAPFLVGEFTIASLTVLYKAGDDSVFQRINAEPMQLIVESLKPSETGDIRDIKPPWEMERDWWALVKPLLIGLLILALIAAGIIFYRRWKAGKALLPVFEKPPRPAHEVAVERLDALGQTDLLATGQVKAYYIELSDIVRTYIEDGLHVPALESTTTDLMPILRQAEVQPEVMDMLHVILTESDLVKFAKHTPSRENSEESVRLAYEVIKRTRPQPELESTAAAEESAAENNDVPVTAVKDDEMNTKELE